MDITALTPGVIYMDITALTPGVIYMHETDLFAIKDPMHAQQDHSLRRHRVKPPKLLV